MSVSSSPAGQPGFDTVLVANRGEIAVRVMRTARAHGYRTVAVYSDADRDAPHVLMADTAVRIGPAPARESYLDAARVIQAARDTGAGAIHPGYGFLSENAEFAAACEEAGLVFVGPTPEAIRLMGDKAAAKRRMERAGVPLLAGYQETDQSQERLVSEAQRVGFPLMVKAAAGGGGKGMRLVTESAQLADALTAARREATAAFGSDALILERAVLRPRHVEVQVLADAHGHVIAVGERDCSIQRRHQKVIEEAPAPGLDSDTRTALHQAAVAAAKEIGYRGAGTVEFLLDEAGTFAFLEMNTRLQVEHPVTEMVTGIDLVDWQLRIAAGERLTVDQHDIRLEGHAIEARLYAEDPDRDFLPQTGTVVAWTPPTGPGVRVDAGVAEGGTVTAHYDPMLAKIIAWGRDRSEARRRLVDALERTVLHGVTTNRAFLATLARHPAFASGDVSTAFLTENEVAAPPVTPRDVAAVAGWLHAHRQADAEARSAQLAGWTNAGWLVARQRLKVAAETAAIRLTPVGGTEAEPSGRDATGRCEMRVDVDGDHFLVDAGPDRVMVDGETVSLAAEQAGPDHLWVRLPHRDLDVRDVLLAPPEREEVAGVGVFTAPMHGAAIAVPVAAGDEVRPGDTLVVLEAMKMEHTVRCDVAGTVSQVVRVGEQVTDGAVVARVVVSTEPEEPDGTEPG
jgi:geranyl-CoA carboxylase alpha subunit